MLFAYPRQATVNRVIPKNKLYEQGKANTALRSLFVAQVTRVVWTHALNPDSTNLPVAAGPEAISEIDIFRIDIRLPSPDAFDHRILRCIDRAIPRPTIFEISSETSIQTAAQLKLSTTATRGSTSRLSKQGHLLGPLYSVDCARQPLPIVTTLQALYERLIEPLLGIDRPSGESITQTVARRHDLTQLDRSIDKLRQRMHQEQQFNRRVELNGQLRELEQQRQQLISLSTSP